MHMSRLLYINNVIVVCIKKSGAIASDFHKWCPDSELNQGHRDFQSLALPTELSGQIMCFHNWWAIRDLNPGPAGYEPDALTN